MRTPVQEAILLLFRISSYLCPFWVAPRASHASGDRRSGSSLPYGGQHPFRPRWSTPRGRHLPKNPSATRPGVGCRDCGVRHGR